MVRGVETLEKNSYYVVIPTLNQLESEEEPGKRDPYTAPWLRKYIVLLSVLMHLQMGAMPVLLIPMSKAFQLDSGTLGLYGGTVYVAMSVGQGLGSFMFRRYRIHQTLACAVTGAAVSLLFTAFLPAGTGLCATPLLLLRLIYGLCLSLITAHAPMWTRRTAPKGRTSAWMVVLQAAIPVGVLLGYSSAAWLVIALDNRDKPHHWRLVFVLQACVLAPAAYLMWFAHDKHLGVFPYVATLPEETRITDDQPNAVRSKIPFSERNTKVVASKTRTSQDRVMCKRIGNEVSESKTTLFTNGGDTRKTTLLGIPTAPQRNGDDSLHSLGSLGSAFQPVVTPRKGRENTKAPAVVEMREGEDLEAPANIINMSHSGSLLESTYDEFDDGEDRSPSQQRCSLNDSISGMSANSNSPTRQEVDRDVTNKAGTEGFTQINGRRRKGIKQLTSSDETSRRRMASENIADAKADTLAMVPNSPSARSTTSSTQSESPSLRISDVIAKDRSLEANHHMSPQGGTTERTISPDVPRVEGEDIDEANEHRHHPFATSSSQELLPPMDSAAAFGGNNEDGASSHTVTYSPFSIEIDDGIRGDFLPQYPSQVSAPPLPPPKLHYSSSSSHTSHSSAAVSNSTRGELPRPSSWMEQRADDHLYFSPSPQDWNLTSTMPASLEHDNHSGDERGGRNSSFCWPASECCLSPHWQHIYQLLLLYRALLRIPTYTSLLFALISLYFITAGLQFYSTAYFIVGLDMEPRAAYLDVGLTLATAPACGVAAGRSFMELVLGGYRGRKRLVALRRCGYLAGLVTTAALIALVNPVPDNEPAAVAACLWVLTFLATAMLPALSGLLVSIVPRDLRGASGRSTGFVVNLFGNSLSVVAIGYSMKWFHDDMTCDAQCTHVVGFRLLMAWAIWPLVLVSLAVLQEIRRRDREIRAQEQEVEGTNNFRKQCLVSRTDGGSALVATEMRSFTEEARGAHGQRYGAIERLLSIDTATPSPATTPTLSQPRGQGDAWVAQLGGTSKHIGGGRGSGNGVGPGEALSLSGDEGPQPTSITGTAGILQGILPGFGTRSSFRYLPQPLTGTQSSKEAGMMGSLSGVVTGGGRVSTDVSNTVFSITDSNVKKYTSLPSSTRAGTPGMMHVASGNNTGGIRSAQTPPIGSNQYTYYRSQYVPLGRGDSPGPPTKSLL